MEDEFYSIDEFAKLMKVSRRTLTRAIDDGKIFFLRVNKTYRIPKSEIARLLAVEYARYKAEEQYE